MIMCLIIYAIFAVTFFAITIADEVRGVEISSTPKELYDCNNFNMFAAWVLCIIFFIFNPLYYLYRFMYWVFHVRRRK